MNGRLIKKILKRERRKAKIKKFFHIKEKEKSFQEQILNFKQLEFNAKQEIYKAALELLDLMKVYYNHELSKDGIYYE